jgi:hypothetical protein
LVVLKSRYNKYLQAVEHTGHPEDGELHASNSHHNEEETWLLYLVDDEKGWYALRNWAHGHYITILPTSAGPHLSGCPRATAAAAAGPEIWIMRPSENFNIAHKFLLQHKDTSRYLVAEGNEGHDTSCGGEVDATMVPFAGRSSADWGGWWTLENSGVPTPGSDVWTAFRAVGEAIGGAIEDITEGVADVVGSIYEILSGGGHIHVCTSDDNNC